MNDGRLVKAQKFMDKFGYGEITIDEFDMFIIDQKWATDPKTSDSSTMEHKVFVTERARQKRALDSAGHFLKEPFQIAIINKGSTWEIQEWNTNTREFTKDVGNRITKFAEGRMNSLRKLHTRAGEMLLLTKDEAKKEALAETMQMVSFMAVKSIELQSNVEAQCLKYNVAADAVEAQVKALLAKPVEVEQEDNDS